MPRQRNYAAEYAARSKESIASRRAETARSLGYETYGRYRTAGEKIAKEFSRLREAGSWDKPAPERGSKTWQDLMRARAVISGYSPKTVSKAAQNKTSLLDRSKEGRALKARLREALGWKKGEGWGAVYYPAMRALY